MAECWDGVPLPAALPTLIDDARLLELLAALEAPDAAADGPEQVGRSLRFTKLQPVEQHLQAGEPVCILAASFGAWQHIAPAFARRGYETGLLDLRPNAQRASPSPAPRGVTLLAAAGYARPVVRWISEKPRVLITLADEGCGPRWACTVFPPGRSA